MKAKSLLLTLSLLVAGMAANAQATLNVGSQVTQESNLVSGTAYIVQSMASGAPYVADAGTYYAVPNGGNSANEATAYYFIANGDGTWKLKNVHTGKCWGVPVYNTSLVPSDESAAGRWSLNFSSGTAYPTAPDADGTVRGLDRSSGQLWGYTTGTGATKQVKIFEILEDTWTPAASEVYTINNTASNRGALIYNPDASTKWVWSSGKSGSFDATAANSQWIFVPATNAGEYFLYNVGARRFAVPTIGGNYSNGNGVCWKFSHDAAPVALTPQSDGTYKIRAPYGDRYMAVSNGFTGPIINYNDAGGNFTITKVADASSEVTAQLNTALGRLIDNLTALTSTSGFTSGGGWYVVHINDGNWTGHSLKTPEEEITYNGTDYALGFYGWGYEHASIASGEHLLRITPSGSGYTWQLPNGRYLCNTSNKFPVSTTTATVVSIDKQTAGFRFYQGGRYATAYLLGNQHFVGETSTSTAIFDVYPANLANAGLTAWQVVGSSVPQTVKLTCTRGDVSGLTAVYMGGYFFLPTGVTPANSDFELEGMVGCTVDATAKTVTVTYDPTLALSTGDVTVTQGYQTAGRGNENTLLLRIGLKPTKAVTNARLTVVLKDGTADNISSLYLYESVATEFIANIPTSPVATASDFASGTAEFSIGSMTSGTHTYWLCATVKDDATLGDILDAKVTSFSYTCNGGDQTLDVTSVGDPGRQGAKVFELQRFVFQPTANSCRYYRIPAMTLDQDGNVVVAIDKRYNSDSDLGNHKIDVVSMRSEDGGRTWQDLANVVTGDGSTAAAYGFGDAALARAQDGTLVCVMAAGSKRWSSSATDGMMYAAVARSTNNGKSWSVAKNIFGTSRFYDEVHGTQGSLGFSNLFTTSGKGLTTTDGVLMFTTNCTEMGTTSPALCYVLYSTDNGLNWRLSNALAYSGCDESKLEQLNDGSLLLSVRQSGNRGWNKATYTKNADGTVTFNWGTSYRTGDISGNACNADIIYYSRETDGLSDILLHSYINTSGRESLQLAMSIDGGQTWKDVYNIQPNGSCYSTMQVLPDGTLALLYEDESYSAGNGYAINYVTISKEQVRSWYEPMDEARKCPDVKIAYGTSGSPNDYGTWDTSVWAGGWTSNDASGQRGLRLESSYEDGLNYASNIYSKRILALKVSDTGATDVITLKAPEGFIIDSYRLSARSYNSGKNYTLTAGSNSISTVYNEWRTLEVNDVEASETTFTVTTEQAQTNYLCVADFTVTLRAANSITLTPCDGLSYATLFLPDGYRLTEDVKAYKITVSGDRAYPTELGQGVPAGTPVLLCSETAVTSAKAIYDTSATADVSGNLLAGNGVRQYVDGYVLNIKDNVPGFYKLSDTGNLAAHRAYLPSSVVDSGVKVFTFQWGSNGIEGLVPQVGGADDAVYDLSGRRVNAQGGSEKTALKKGVYIIGGRKVLVK